MVKFVKRYLNLLLPCLFKNTSSKIATTATLLLTGLEIWAATWAPKLFGILVQSYQEADFSYIVYITVALIGCRIINKTHLFLHHIIFFRVVNRAIRDIRMQVVMQLHKIPWHLQKKYKMSEVINVTNRVSPSLRVLINTTFVTILPALFKIITLAIAMMRASSDTWYFPILVSMTYIHVFFGMRKVVRSRYSAWEVSDDVAVATKDSLSNTKFAKYYIDLEEKRLRKLFDSEEQLWERNNTYLYTTRLIQALLFVLIAGGLTLHMVIKLRAGQIALGQFTTINGYMITMYYAMANVTARTRMLITSMIDIDKALKILDLAPHNPNTLRSKLNYNKRQAILQVKDLFFSYSNNYKTIIRNCSFSIEKGDKIAIVGSSGAGKSTLAHLLAGLYKPQAGKVLLNGISMQQLSLATIGETIHFIEQEAPIINGSIADNLMGGHRKIYTQPLDYLKERMHHSTGDGGGDMSRGEKQRILIARCLTYNPEVLILDETLSSLDEVTSHDLLAMIFARISTVLLITHSKSLTKNCSKIYQMKYGQLTLID